MEQINEFKKYVGKFEEPGVVLTEPMAKYDFRKEIATGLGFSEKFLNGNLRKALSTTLSTYSAGTLPVLIPVYVDPEIIDLTRRATPLVELIPRVTNYGRTAEYNQITALGSAKALPEDSALAEADDTYVRRTVAVKFLYAVGRVTGQMFAASKQYLASGGYVDALSLEVKNKTISLKRLEEEMILLGNGVSDWTDYNSTTQSGANSFNGLWQLISNSNSNGLGGSSSYTTDKAGGALGISDIRTAIRTPRTNGGEPNLMVCDYSTFDKIKALIQDELRYVSTTTVAWGITTVSFEGLPIIASRFLKTTNGDGTKDPTSGVSLFVMDTNVIEMRVLQDVSYEEMAKTNDSMKFSLKVYETLVVKAPQFNFVMYDYA